jgi:prolyl 4-hydroxylase
VPGAAGTTAALARGGQRTITMFVYLNNLDEFETGGGTRFPKVNNLTIRPVRGQAVIWNNTLPSGVEDDRTLHGGDPPKQSTKYGLNIWFRQKEFR